MYHFLFFYYYLPFSSVYLVFFLVLACHGVRLFLFLSLSRSIDRLWHYVTRRSKCRKCVSKKNVCLFFSDADSLFLNLRSIKFNPNTRFSFKIKLTFTSYILKITTQNNRLTYCSSVFFLIRSNVHFFFVYWSLFVYHKLKLSLVLLKFILQIVVRSHTKSKASDLFYFIHMI